MAVRRKGIPLQARRWLRDRQPNRTDDRSARGAATGPESAARAAGARPTGAARHRLRLPGQEAFALGALARQLAGPADCLRPFPCLFLRWLFVVAAKFHLAEDALALHLFLERLEGLVDVVVADENLHASFLLDRLRLSGNIDPRVADAPLPSVGGLYQNCGGKSTLVSR